MAQRGLVERRRAQDARDGAGLDPGLSAFRASGRRDPPTPALRPYDCRYAPSGSFGDMNRSTQRKPSSTISASTVPTTASA